MDGGGLLPAVDHQGAAGELDLAALPPFDQARVDQLLDELLEVLLLGEQVLQLQVPLPTNTDDIRKNLIDNENPPLYNAPTGNFLFPFTAPYL